jgi:hypothetical protein
MGELACLLKISVVNLILQGQLSSEKEKISSLYNALTGKHGGAQIQEGGLICVFLLCPAVRLRLSPGWGESAILG